MKKLTFHQNEVDTEVFDDPNLDKEAVGLGEFIAALQTLLPCLMNL